MGVKVKQSSLSGLRIGVGPRRTYVTASSSVAPDIFFPAQVFGLESIELVNVYVFEVLFFGRIADQVEEELAALITVLTPDVFPVTLAHGGPDGLPSRLAPEQSPLDVGSALCHVLQDVDTFEGLICYRLHACRDARSQR